MLKFTGTCLRGMLSLVLWVWVAVLFLCLIGHLYILGSLARHGHVRIPDAWVDQALKTAAPAYWVKHDGVFLNFGGVISAHSLEVGYQGVRDAIVDTENILLDVNVGMLLIGRFQLERVWVQDASLVCPTVYSPTGVAEELMRVAQLDVRASDDQYRVDSGLFSYGPMDGWVHGVFRLPSLRFFETWTREEPSDKRQAAKKVDLKQIEAGLRQLYDIRQSLAQVRAPSLQIGLSSGQMGHNTVSIRASGLGLDLPELKLTTEAFFANVTAEFMHNACVELAVNGEVEAVQWDTVWHAQSIDFNRRLSASVDLQHLIKDIALTVVNLAGPGMNAPINQVFAETSLESLFEIPLEVVAFWEGAHVYADIDLALLRQKARIALETRNLGVKQLGTLEAVLNTQLPTWLWGLEASHFHWETVLAFDGAWQKIDIWGDTGPIAYQGVWLDNAWGEIELYPDHLELKDFAISGPIGTASGNLDFAWPSMDLEVYISAEMLPISINAWMEPWWVNLWKPFSFRENERPDADFYVKTSIGKKSSTTFFGHVDAGATAYQGAWFDSGSATVWGRPKFTEVFDLQAHRPEGSAYGGLNWTFFHDRYGLKLLQYNLNGRVDLRNGERIFPGVVQDITRNFKPEGPIDLEVAGFTYGKGARPIEKIREEGGDITAVADAPIEVYGIHLDSMDMEARFDPRGVQVPQLAFTAGGGQGEGSLSVTIPHGGDDRLKPELSVDMRLDALRKDRVFHVFPMLQGPSHLPIEDDQGDARIALNVAAAGDPNDKFSFYGSGRVWLTGTKLDDIHLFGELSETLANTPFPVGALSLTELQSPVNIRGNTLEFKNVKGSGRGARLRGDGTYHMEQDHLNFKLVVSPGNMSETPVYSLFTAILRPVASALPIRVWGPFSEPNWALDMFTSEPEVAERPAEAAKPVENPPAENNMKEEALPQPNTAGDPVYIDDLGEQP